MFEIAEPVNVFRAFILVCAEPVKLFSGTMLVEPPPPPKPNAVICAELDTIPLGNCTELLIVPLGSEVKYELVAAFYAFILV